MAGNLYSRGEHLKVLDGYLQNIERAATHVKTIEDWQLVSVDLLDNCQAARELIKCMA
jgi:hypothetical protein